MAILPKEATIDNLRFTTREWDNGCDCGSYPDIYYVTIKPNTCYKSQLKEYEKALARFAEKKIIFDKEVEQYKLDVKEYLAWAKKEKYWVDENKYKEIKKKYFKKL